MDSRQLELAEDHPRDLELLAAAEGRVLGCRRIGDPCGMEHGLLPLAPE